MSGTVQGRISAVPITILRSQCSALTNKMTLVGVLASMKCKSVQLTSQEVSGADRQHFGCTSHGGDL